MTFPKVTGKNLNGKEFQLPRDFEGKLNLAIIAFKREQQDIINPWIEVAGDIQAKHPGFVYYELPTIYRANPLFRAWVNSGMARGIPSEKAREVTITLYLDKSEFRDSLDIPNEDTIYLFLIKPDGNVAWTTSGERTDEGAKALRAAVDELMPKAK